MPISKTVLHDVALDITGCTSGQEIRSRARDALEGLTGVARVTVSGELEPDVNFRADDVSDVATHLEAVVTRRGHLEVSYDVEALRLQPTVEGQFVRSVEEADLEDDERRQVLVAGLRALHGRDDLEIA